MLKVKDWLLRRSVQQFNVVSYFKDVFGDSSINTVLRIFDNKKFSIYLTSIKTEVVDVSIHCSSYIDAFSEDLIHANLVCICLNPEDPTQAVKNSRNVEINNIEMEAQFLLDFTTIEFNSKYKDNN